MGDSRPNLSKFVIWCCIGLAASSSLYGQSAREIAQRSFPAVVLLVMEDSKGHPVSLASGFFVNPGIIATNLHVVQGAAKGYAQPVDLSAKYALEAILGIDARHDLVLLSVAQNKSPVLALEKDVETAVGDEVYALGNPRGLEGTFSNGIVSAIRKVEEDTLLQITAPISPGSSGGPVLNPRGNVIGIAAATLKNGQNLNFAIPAAYLAKLLSRMTPPQPLSGRSDISPSQSVFRDLGGASKDGVIPTNPAWVWNFLEFRLRNDLDLPVRNIRLRFAFYDAQGEMVSFVEDEFEKPIGGQGSLPAGYTILRYCSVPNGDRIRQLTSNLDIQVLDFEIVQPGIPPKAGASDEAWDRKVQELWDKVQYYFRTRQSGLAIFDLTELRKLRAEDPEVSFYFGEYYSRHEQYEQAVTAYSDALRRKPDHAAGYNGRGVAYELLRRYTEAIADYTEAIRLRPDYAEAYRNRGDARKKSGDKRGAKVDYEKAKALRR